jgi:hypothetical protein
MKQKILAKVKHQKPTPPTILLISKLSKAVSSILHSCKKNQQSKLGKKTKTTKLIVEQDE